MLAGAALSPSFSTRVLLLFHHHGALGSGRQSLTRCPASPPPLCSPSPARTLSSIPKASPKWGSVGDSWGDSDVEELEEEEKEEDGQSGDEEEAKNHVAVPSAAGVGHDKSSLTQYQELVEEVEQLLGPEEKVILEQNEVPNLNKISTMKWNPFHSLALSHQIPLMDELLELGTDIDCLDKDGFAALHKAIIGKKEAVISHLLRKGANPHIRDRDGATPLHHAVQVGAMQTVKLLIKYRVDVNVADNDGWTPLHLAIQCRSRDIAKILLINGADKARRNKDGKTPLDLSLCFGKDFKSYELAKLLKLVPADRNI